MNNVLRKKGRRKSRRGCGEVDKRIIIIIKGQKK